MKYCTSCNAKYDDSVSFCSIDGEVLEADPASIVNTVLDGQYQMEALLGRGGMGAVYRARHILLGDRVAIKVLPPEVRTNAEWLRRFRREGQAARRFRHPNSVTVYDLRTASDGTIYMVMEYVEGHTLDHELKTRGRLTAAEALEILTPIMSVLDTAHSMGVVHRDLKPENIMIGKATEHGAPVVKLLDLGIAKMREIAGDNGGNTALTMAGQVLGTPYYMSPEQWGEIPRDQNPEIDGRADIYSLGLVFYEMISGRRPFAGNTLHELRREHVTTTPKPLCEVAPGVPLGFSAAIQRATAKDRGDRQDTASQLASELRAGLTTAVQPPPLPADLAETVGPGREVETKSDVTAPTILTVDSTPTSPTPPRASSTTAPTVVERRKQEPANVPSPPKMPDATVAESSAMASSVTAIPVPRRPVAPQPAAPSVPAPAVEKKGGKAGLIIGMVVVVLVLAVAGGASIYLWTRSKGTTGGTTTTSSGSNTAAVSTPREIARYWLELESARQSGEPTRVPGLAPLASGQSFKFHFNFSETGYVYIFGPGEKNQPTAFLTTKPLPESGVRSNQVTGGSDFSFPSGQGNNVTLDKSPGTDVFTVIFAKTAPASPAFLNEPVTGEPLSAAQQAELKSFAGKYGEKPPVTELDESNPRAPSVRVKVPADQTNNPIVFEIRIQHN
ncbi:MAG TPA: protein kinase [Pyrinomonadaceae bacterium]|nr:protein kinase [Pyrinomonadaceae bacterium]